MPPDRTAYNDCMKPYITGKGLPQAERRLNFCVGAKICNGKAQTEDQARQICLTQPPKPPKERKQRDGTCPPCPCAIADSQSTAAPPAPAKPLTCEEHKAEALVTMDQILDKVKEGDAAGTVAARGQLLEHLACQPREGGALEMARGVNETLSQMSKGYYFKGEIRELKSEMDLLRRLIT